ncbi:MAG: 3-oxoacyl-ACP reductase FabG [Lentisphaerae bacterium]|jgi:3-oxoacyl-[acyl-carrier protein] reductase|nr:3-oxoacyl-ACP reductase FabG [Lentisphaerota bacterium]
MTKQFAGQVALVTGGTRGIGRSIAERLASAGARIGIVGTDASRTDKAASDISSQFGVQVCGYACDVADTQAAEQVINRIIEDFGKLDILVNNAGITRDNLLMRMQEADWDAVLATNLKGIFNFCKPASRLMLKARSGRIINISSVVALLGNAGQSNYAAAKAGIIGFSKSLARELASRNVTVNVIAPGFIDTEMTAALPEAARLELQTRIPLGRIGSTEDIAAAVEFLASPAAAYITGQVLCVDGGMTMG